MSHDNRESESAVQDRQSAQGEELVQKLSPLPEPDGYEPPNNARELLARYSDGERYFEEANLQGANLRDADLQGANLRMANLQGAELQGANLQRARLVFANLQGANLIRANLQEANLHGANLQGSILVLVKFQGADLVHVKFQGADLQFADLQGADLQSANLQDSNCIYVDHLHLNSSFVRNAQFSPASFWPHKPDYWTQLRQRYTGTAMIFHLILLTAFLVPLIGRALFWHGINEAQSGVNRHLAPMRDNIELLAIQLADQNLSPETRAMLEQLREYSTNENWTRCLKAECHDRPVWRVMLQTDKGIVDWGLALLLLLYNLCRATLTRFVGPLREEEERSGWSPEYTFGVRVLYYAHYAVWFLGWVALAAFLWHGYGWMTGTISVPW